MTDEERLAEYAQLIADASAALDPVDAPVLLKAIYVDAPVLLDDGVLPARLRWEVLADADGKLYAEGVLVTTEEET